MVEIKLLDLKDVLKERINIKRPLIYPNNEMTTFELYYNNETILIDMSCLHICEKSKNIKLTDTSQSIHKLNKLIKDILMRVKNNEKYMNKFRNKEMYKMIEEEEEEEEKCIKFNNICEYDTTVFDILGDTMCYKELKKNDKVRLILYMKNLWVNDRFYGINIKISQIQRLEPLGIKKLIVNPRVIINPVMIKAPPPPPQLPLNINNIRPHIQPKITSKNRHTENLNSLKKIMRPSLMDILNSRGNLRKTNLLS